MHNRESNLESYHTFNPYSMKRKLLFSAFILISAFANAQYPLLQYLGSDSTMVRSRGGMQGRFAPIPFTDTATANLSRISQYPGALIYTSGVDKYWYRNATATGWNEFTSSGGSTVNIYNSNGVLTGDRNLDGTGFSLGFHTLSKFWTQSDTVDIELLSGGAKIFNIHNLTSTQDTTTYKPIVVDPVTGRVMQSSYWYGGTGGSGGSGIVSLGTSAYGLTIQNDSTYKADTIQLSTRLWRQKGIDSVQGNVTSGLALKLNLSDTASMLTNYVRRQELKDTAAAIRSAIGGGGSGSVTSVGSGYGLSGGPITTTGTLLVDSATLSNHYLRRKDSLTASNLLGYVTRQVLADSMSAIATSYILNEITTGYDSLSYVEADTLKLKGLRVVAGTNATVTPTITGTTISYSISGNDTTSLSNRINLKLSIADTANMLLNYVRRQELKDTAAAIRSAITSGGSSDTSTFIVDTTFKRLAYAINEDSLRLKSVTIDVTTGQAASYEETDSTLKFTIPQFDSEIYGVVPPSTGTTTDFLRADGTWAAPAGGGGADSSVFATQYRLDTVKANRVRYSDTAAMLTNYPTFSSFTSGRLALVNGSKTLYSSSKFVFSDALYPTMGIVGSDPTIYMGAVSTAYPSVGSASGLSLSGGSTYKSVNLYGSISGDFLARFYSSAGTIYNDLFGLIKSSTLSSPSNYQGSYHIQRTVPYSSGLNYHGYTDGTVFNAQSTAFNSFGSFVTFGNDRFTQNHYAAFQSVWYKDSSNTMGKVYDFVSAVSEHREGTIDTLFRYKVFPVTVTGGATLNVEYGIHLPAGSASTNYGAYIEDNVGLGTASPTAKLDINSDKFRVRTSKTPSSATDTGNAGDICWDSNYIYICVSTNSWKRVAIATW